MLIRSKRLMLKNFLLLIVKILKLIKHIFKPLIECLYVCMCSLRFKFRAFLFYHKFFPIVERSFRQRMYFEPEYF